VKALFLEPVPDRLADTGERTAVSGGGDEARGSPSARAGIVGSAEAASPSAAGILSTPDSAARSDRAGVEGPCSSTLRVPLRLPGRVGVSEGVGPDLELEAGLPRVLADDELDGLGRELAAVARGEEELLLPCAADENGPPLARSSPCAAWPAKGTTRSFFSLPWRTKSVPWPRSTSRGPSRAHSATRRPAL
jgi:hypothetical protein